MATRKTDLLCSEVFDSNPAYLGLTKSSSAYRKLTNLMTVGLFTVHQRLHAVERGITSRNGGDAFQMTIEVIEILKMHAETSELAKEIFESMQQDFWYGISPENVDQHPGHYYIDSVQADI